VNFPDAMIAAETGFSKAPAALLKSGSAQERFQVGSFGESLHRWQRRS